MPRSPRVVAVGAPHHVTQRGNARQDVFLDNTICRIYLELLAQHATRNGLHVLAYCLMTNHVHLVALPETPASLANTFRHTHARFAQYWNTHFQRTGHLWQNRFYSCPIEESQVWRVVRYVEQNPVRAGMTDTAAAYPWSSAPAHVGVAVSSLLDGEWWSKRWTAESWAEVMRDASDDAAAIRLATFTGRPYGSGAFVHDLGTKLGRQLERRKGGRPRKEVDGTTQMPLWETEK